MGSDDTVMDRLVGEKGFLLSGNGRYTGACSSGFSGENQSRDALVAAAQAVMGSARLLLELMDRVISPGGATIAWKRRACERA